MRLSGFENRVLREISGAKRVGNGRLKKVA